jgi:pimeloyl-ACP methyl ester carboxylesterase
MPDPSPKFDERSWQTADGLNLYYRDYAGSDERPPILCLHGLTRNSRDFAEIAQRYAGDFRVIALDFRGRGNSDRDAVSGNYVPATYANDALGLLESLGIGSAIFFGTSLGGLVTMITAALEPQRIAGAILNDIGPDLNPIGAQRIGNYVGRDISFADWGEAAAHVASLANGLPERFDSSDWLRIAHQLCREQGDRIVLDYDRRIAEPFKLDPPDKPYDMWPLFRALAVKPVLVLRGEHSDLLSAATAERMEAEGSDTRIVLVPGVGHAPWLDEPEVTEAVDRFLERWKA